jgi:2-C-methyl-D-erythritol 4-phosphate cytidylyltransferase
MAAFSVLILTAAPPGQGGQGAEAGGAFVKIDGRESLLRSVELFLNRPNVKQIHLAIQPDGLEEARQKYGAHLGFSGVKLISAGPRWMDQIAGAVAMLNPEATHVLLHDAARAAVPYSDIDALMEAAEKHEAVALSTPVRGTLVETDEGGSPVAFHLPTHFSQLLTPQAFSKAAFLEMASKKTELHPSRLTLLKGSPLNVRIGGPGDATLLKSMLNMLPKPKSKAAINPFDEAQW